MSINNIEKVLTVIQGMAHRDADLATKYIHPTNYIEHNPLVADGISGLQAYIAGFSVDKHQLSIIRAFQDGSFVFTQEDGNISGKNTFFEVFRFDGDWIVEHWAFSEKSAPPNQSGHTQIDGPTIAKSGQDLEKNKLMMRDYYETVHIAGDHSKIPKYFSGDLCIRHEPDVKDGVAAFMVDLKSITFHRTIDEITLILGQGDFIFIAAKGTLEGDICCYIDLYRVEDEKIVEHWGFIETVSSPEDWKNNNGML